MSQASPSIDVALLIVRVVLVWVFIYYGAGKLFGLFNGPGLHRTALFMAETAHLRPGTLFAVIGGLIEFVGAIALAIGMASRVAALLLIGDQIVAMITVTWTHGINSLSATPGYEFNLTLVALGSVVLILGAGRFGIDYLLSKRLASPTRSHGSGDFL